MLKSTWQRFWRDERGAEMVEWAVVTLILLTSTVVVIMALRQEIIRMFAAVFAKIQQDPPDAY
jgi:Flp pilus assembly pilin Flp